jgi:hypothetical protein
MLWRIPLVIIVAGLFPAGPALAASGPSASAAGSAQAAVISPIGITNTAALRFGQVIRPTSTGTIVVAPNGAITTTGGVVGNDAIAQTGTGRGPAGFFLTTNRGAAVHLTLPNSFTITSGGNSMQISNLTTSSTSIPSAPPSHSFIVKVGGTLTLAANQPAGTYTGTFTLTAVYQ